MRNHTLNLYKIGNLPNLNFSYKLVETDLVKLENKEDLYNRQMHKIAQKVSSLTSGPAAPLHKEGKLFIAVPADRTLSDQKIDIAPFGVSVKLLDTIYHIPAGAIALENRELVQKFLEFEIRRQLSNHPQLWKLNVGQFFQKRPVQSNVDSSIEIFGGFNYKLVCLEDGQFYVVLDITYKYIDKQPTCNYVNTGNVLSAGNNLKGRRFLYQNGDNWYTVELVGFGKKIKDQDYLSEDKKPYKVYDYIISKTQHHRFRIQSLLKPDDITIFYKYPGRSMEPHVGASSLARMLYHTSDAEVKSLHRFSIREPNKRFETINKIINSFFGNLTFDKKPLNISRTSEMESVRNFAIPTLKYANDRTLTIGARKSGIDISDFGTERKQFLLDNGVITKAPFDPQYLIVPESLDRRLVTAIKKNVEFQIKRLAPEFNEFKIIRYKTDTTKAATYQVQEIEKVLKAQNAQNTLIGFALFILPDVAIRQKRQITIFHDCLKSKFYPDLKVQCVSGYKIGNFFQAFPANGDIEYRVPEQQKPKFRPYLHNLVFEHLLMNRKWPFALAESLHYDIYIGVDVHERYAGFTFFFKNGQKIFFDSVKVPKKNRSQRAEKLKVGLLRKILYEKLKVFIPLHAPNPNGIILVRDGRSFGDEEKALLSVVADLEKEGILNKDKVQLGVVDLYKQSIVPLRLASQTNGHNVLENPIAGAYKLFSGGEGFLFNTGYPFQIPGTAKPLHLSLKAGDVDFLKVMEDIFRQSMLAFSAPDRSNALPVTIKLIDTLLEPLAAATEQLDEEEEDYTLEEEMDDNTE